MVKTLTNLVMEDVRRLKQKASLRSPAPECARPRAQQGWKDGGMAVSSAPGRCMLLRPGWARSGANRRRQSFQRGALITELVVAMAILTIAVLPLAFSFAHERQLLKRAYYHAVAMEIVDGEMEILAAGEWRSYPSGTQPYTVRAQAAANLPPGTFQLTVATNLVRLEWFPQEKHVGGRIAREALVQ